MLQTKASENIIIGQQLFGRYDMRVLKQIVAVIVITLMAYAVVAVIYNLPYNVASYMLIGLGLAMFIFSILTNLKRNSPLKLGAANRAEFYSVVVVLIGVMLSINGRIDAIYQILITMK